MPPFRIVKPGAGLGISLIIALLITVVTTSSARSAGQSVCEATAETMKQVREKLAAAPANEELDDLLQRLKYVTSECPNDGDAWYFRAKVEQRLNRPARDVDSAMNKARQLRSIALRDGLDPFAAGSATSPHNSPSPLTAKDTRPPQITITAPAVKRGQSARVKSCSIRIEGRVTDDSEVRDVAINGAPATVDKQGEFSTNLALNAGENRIFVTATDAQGNTARENFTLVCDSAPPVIAATPSPASPSTGSPLSTLLAAKPYALVIGINNYRNLPKLGTAVNDATEVARVLREEFGFETKLLLDADATRDNILDALEAYERLLKDGGSLLIYYAGHGQNDTAVKKAYWQPVNATSSRSNWISADDVTTQLRGIQAQQILVVSDSCYSGEMARSANARPAPPPVSPAERHRYLERMAKEKSRMLMASGGDEPVADGGGGNHSIFAAKFLLGLRELNKTMFTANELFDAYVGIAVGGNSDQLPRHSQLLPAGHVGGDFIFIRRQ